MAREARVFLDSVGIVGVPNPWSGALLWDHTFVQCSVQQDAILIREMRLFPFFDPLLADHSRICLILVITFRVDSVMVLWRRGLRIASVLNWMRREIGLLLCANRKEKKDSR